MPGDLLMPPMGSGARLSEDGLYRYELTRRWAYGPTATFIMLNPSTADATLDDPTIRRCKGFSKSWNMGALCVVNLFALRSSNPKSLLVASDPVGPENDDAIHDIVVRSRIVIAAWGVFKDLRGRDDAVLELFHMLGRDIFCLQLTKHGSPKHPLYCKSDLKPLLFGRR